MKSYELEEKIEKAFKEKRANVCDKVIESCKREPQLPPPEPKPSLTDRLMDFLSGLSAKKALAMAVCLVILITGLSFVFMIPRGDNSNAGAPADVQIASTVYLDVNPSVMIRLDADDNIISCSPENADADHIVEGLDLKGKSIREGISQIMASMRAHDCLSSNANSILISVESDAEHEAELLSGITEEINQSFEGTGMECSIIAQSVQVNDALKAEAEALGVSVGKMHLINKMVGAMDEYTDADKQALSEMSIKELNLIYNTREEETDGEEFGEDISSGSVGGYITDRESLLELLASQGIEKDSIEDFHIRIGIDKIEGKHHLFYIITVKVTGEPQKYKIWIDCITGEILSLEAD